MLSKEEYKRQLVRMWDSLREDRHKGSEDCDGVYCKDCPLEPSHFCKGKAKLIDLIEIAEIVENWTKEHPVVTNKEKFEEMFGIDAPLNRCIKNNVGCSECEYYDDKGFCRVDERFWLKEYEEEYDD